MIRCSECGEECEAWTMIRGDGDRVAASKCCDVEIAEQEFRIKMQSGDIYRFSSFQPLEELAVSIGANRPWMVSGSLVLNYAFIVSIEEVEAEE